MPSRAKTICRHPGCGKLIDTPGYCDRHQVAFEQRKAAFDKQRGSAHERGYTSRWHKARRLFLLSSPLCVACQRAGRLTAATVVDHIVPHRGDAEIFWDRTNWQTLCASCHSAKTAREDGGFGNPTLR
jgi:5-methylcytosine-specific restriction protein A